MEENNLTKYERRQMKKAEDTKLQKSQKNKSKIIRYGLWIGVIILLLVTFWQINRMVSSNKDKSPLNTATSTALTIKNSDWINGATSSPVVLIEYSDFQCPACAEYDKLIDRLKADYGENLTLVYRHYPWFFHQQAMNAALASEAAGQQDKFWEMHDILFARQEKWSGTVGQEIFATYAKELGLDLEAFKTAMIDKKLRQKIEGQLQEGKNLGIDYTPAFAINGKIIENPKNYEEFRQIIDQASKSR
jgi:protein-disulfide isomerase